MRVLLINQVFYPDHAATAQHAHDLARHLIAHGHEVQVIASRSIYGERGAGLAARETVDGAEVYRVGRSLFGKAGLIARAADFALFYLMATIKAFTIPRADVVVCFTTPPFIAVLGRIIRLFRGSRFVYWVMDMYPDVPVACGVMKPGSPITRFFDWLDRGCLKSADRVVVLGRCMRERVLAKGVAAQRVEHIGVWSDQGEVRPIPRDANEYTGPWGLGDKFVIMYSGNFGLAHDVRTMLDAAERLQDDPRFRFLFVGGGKKMGEVRAFVDDRRIANAVVAGYQPRAKLDHSLSAADVHLATMIAGAEGLIVPCKLFGIMAASRPTIFIGAPSSELSLVLQEHDAGVIIRPGDVDGLVATLRELADDPARTRAMGENARRGLAESYNRDAACERWRILLEQVVAHNPNAAPVGATAPTTATASATTREAEVRP